MPTRNGLTCVAGSAPNRVLSGEVAGFDSESGGPLFSESFAANETSGNCEGERMIPLDALFAWSMSPPKRLN